MDEYIIVSGVSASELAMNVNQHIANGYWTSGGICYAGGEVRMFYQALVLEDLDEDED